MAGAKDTWKATTLVVMAVAIALVLVWQLLSAQKPPIESGKESAVLRPRPRHEAEPSPRRSSGAARHSEIVEDESSGDSIPAIREQSDPAGDDKAEVKPMAQLLREVPAKMLQVARHCFDPAKHPANSAERVSFRYTMIYQGGEARVSDVVPVDSNINDEDLQSCILDSVAEIAWPAHEVPNRKSRRQQLSISIYDLSR